MFVAVAAVGLLMSSVYGLNAAGEKKVDTNADTIKMVVSEVALVTFEANPTTGYSWAVSGESASKVVQILSHSYIPNFNPKHFVGRGGVEIWKFKALKKGKAAFTFNYVRPWEKNIPPVQTRQLKFVVEKIK